MSCRVSMLPERVWLWGCQACGEVHFRAPGCPQAPEDGQEVQELECPDCGPGPHDFLGEAEPSRPAKVKPWGVYWLWGCFGCGRVRYRAPDLPVRPNEDEETRFMGCPKCGKDVPYQLLGPVKPPVKERLH